MLSKEFWCGARPQPEIGLLRFAWALLVLLILPACGGYHCAGPNCDCEGRRECIVDCQGNGCDIACSHTSESCGAICGQDCSFECSHTNHCSSFTGDGSIIDCHQVPGCASECGDDCYYEAHDVSEVHLTTGKRSDVRIAQVAQAEMVVGPGSSVECTGVSQCRLTCDGPCDFACSEGTGVATCDLQCRGSSEPTSGGGGCE